MARSSILIPALLSVSTSLNIAVALILPKLLNHCDASSFVIVPSPSLSILPKRVFTLVSRSPPGVIVVAIFFALPRGPSEGPSEGREGPREGGARYSVRQQPRGARRSTIALAPPSPHPPATNPNQAQEDVRCGKLQGAERGAMARQGRVPRCVLRAGAPCSFVCLPTQRVISKGPRVASRVASCNPTPNNLVLSDLRPWCR